MWEPKVGEWAFIYTFDFAAGHHYFVYTIEYIPEEKLKTLSYGFDQKDLVFSTIDDEDDVLDYIDSTDEAEVEHQQLRFDKWLSEGASAFKTKDHFKYAPQFIKFVFKIILQKK